MSGKTIVVLNLSETENDPRVRRFCSALGRAGHRVLAINPRGGQAEARSQQDHFEIIRAPEMSRSLEPQVEQLIASAPKLGQVMQAIEAALRPPFSLRQQVQHRVQRRAMKALARVSARTGGRLGAAENILAKLEVTALLDVWRMRWQTLGAMPLAFEALPHRPDIVWSNDTNTLLAGLAIKERTGARFVFDAHEAFTEQLPPGEVQESVLETYRQVEAGVLPHTDARCTVCDSVGNYYQERYKTGAFQTIRNVPSKRFLMPESVLARRNAPRVAIYQGAYFRFRGLEPLIEATRYLEHTVLHLRGVGQYETELRAQAERIRRPDRIRFLPAVKVDALVESASHADIGLNLFPSLCLNTSFALPNKYFEYLAGGLATASSDLVELRAHTERYKTGVLVPSLDPQIIAQALDALSQDPARLDAYREAGWRAARDELHWETEQSRLMRLIDGL